jgi:surfeit locus 1 family protein
MRFRPTFWATIAFIPVFVLLMYLGTWQVQRLQWKNNLIQTRVDRIASSPLEFTAAREAASPQIIEYRPITVSGLLRNDHRFRLLNRVHNSLQGSHMVVPMVLDGGQGTIMVDRGWIPRGLMTDIPAEPVARVVLNGYVRAYTERTPFLPPNEPDRNNWFHMHEAEMLTASGLMSGVGFYVEAGPNVQAPDLLPAGAVPDINLRNNHLQYAGTWYGVGAVLFIIFIVFHWRRYPL